MLENKKSILRKVSFDMGMFTRELQHTIPSLNNAEAKELRTWCDSHFGGKYHEAIKQCFGNYATA